MDFCEYIQAISLMNEKSLEKKLKLIFRTYDHDNDGRIDQCDIEYTISAILQLNGLEERKGANSAKERTQNFLKMFDSSVVEEYEFIEKCLADSKLIELIRF